MTASDPTGGQPTATTRRSTASRSTASRSTASTATRALGIVALVGVAVLVLFGLVVTPADVNQGDSVRFVYLHPPTAWVAYLAFGVTAIASALYLFAKRHALGWDRLAGASAEIGVLFFGLTIFQGMLWGRLTWGVFWRWDARLTTSAFLFVTFVGYLAVRRLGGTLDQRAKRSGVFALLAVLQIPLVHWSVKLWRGLHQEATVLRIDGDVKMDGLMLFTMLGIGFPTFTVIYLWLVIHRQRALTAEDLLDDVGLEVALAERRREGGLDPSSAPAGDGAVVGS